MTILRRVKIPPRSIALGLGASLLAVTGLTVAGCGTETDPAATAKQQSDASSAASPTAPPKSLDEIAAQAAADENLHDALAALFPDVPEALPPRAQARRLQRRMRMVKKPYKPTDARGSPVM